MNKEQALAFGFEELSEDEAKVEGIVPELCGGIVTGSFRRNGVVLWSVRPWGFDNDEEVVADENVSWYAAVAHNGNLEDSLLEEASDYNLPVRGEDELSCVYDILNELHRKIDSVTVLRDCVRREVEEAFGLT